MNRKHVDPTFSGSTTTTTVVQKAKGNNGQSKKCSPKKTSRTNADACVIQRRRAVWMVALIAVTASALYLFVSRGFYPDESRLMLAAYHETIDKRYLELDCYREDHEKAPIEEQIILAECVPICGRAIYDNVVTMEEVDLLKTIMKKLNAIAQSTDYVSYVDLISGQFFYNNTYKNMYRDPTVKEAISQKDFENVIEILIRLQKIVINTFNGSMEKISDFKSAEFFSIIPGPGKRETQAAYRIHTENVVSVGVCYTALLYLSDFEVDFHGSRFTFHDRLNNETVHIVHPKRARLVVFTSGSENNHRVEKILSGERFAISVGLSCNKTSRPFPTYQNFTQIELPEEDGNVNPTKQY